MTELRGKLAGDPLADCFYELIYYPVMASANILKMNLYAGLSQFYVKQRKKLGNRFAPKVQECIDKDKKLTEEYHTLLGGKWNHMQSVFHVGYIGWNDEEWQYPDCHILHPVNAPRLLVSISEEEKTTGGNPWRRTTLPINLVSPIAASKCIDVANGGEGELFFRIRWSDPRIQIIQIGAQIDTKRLGKTPMKSLQRQRISCSFRLAISQMTLSLRHLILLFVSMPTMQKRLRNYRKIIRRKSVLISQCMQNV